MRPKTMEGIQLSFNRMEVTDQNFSPRLTLPQPLITTDATPHSHYFYLQM